MCHLDVVADAGKVKRLPAASALLIGILVSASLGAEGPLMVPAPVVGDPSTVIPGTKAVARRITMLVADLQRSKAFYEALGFKEDRRAEVSDAGSLKVFGLPAGTQLTFIRRSSDNTLSTGRIDGGTIGLAQVHNRQLKQLRRSTGGATLIGTPILIMTTDGVDSIYLRLKTMGAEIIEAPMAMPGGLRTMVARDPDGMRMEITQARLAPVPTPRQPASQ